MNRPTGVPGRVVAALALLAGFLVAAFVAAPRVLAAGRSGGGFVDEPALAHAFRQAFEDYWRAGERDFSPGLAALVQYWLRYHVAKAVIAAMLLSVLIALGVLLWKGFVRAGGSAAGKAAHASAGVAVTVLGLGSVAAVMANIQGAVAPFASLLPMLGPDGSSAGTLDQVRQRLADVRSADDATPAALQVMINDFAEYHVAMVVIAGVLAVALIGICVLLWRRFAATVRSDRRARRVLASFGALATSVALAALVLAAANISVAADPAPALLAFFNGGW